MTSATIPTTPQLGWVGLGNMGYPMSKNLANSLSEGETLHVYNRTSSKCTQLQSEATPGRVTIAGSLADLAAQCTIIFTSLSSDAAARDVFKSLLASAPPDRRITFVDTSTVAPATTAELHAQITNSEQQHDFLAAPAFGPPPMAAAAQLVFVLAGAAEVKSLVTPHLIPAVGRKSMDFGTDPTRAAKFKLVGNSFIASLIESLAESMTLSEQAGLGQEAFFNFVQEFVPAPSAIGYGKKILTNNFNPTGGFDVDGGLKDLGHIQDLASSVGVQMPTINAARQHLTIAKEAARGKELDWSAIAVGQRIQSGVKEPFGDAKGSE